MNYLWECREISTTGPLKGNTTSSTYHLQAEIQLLWEESWSMGATVPVLPPPTNHVSQSSLNQDRQTFTEKKDVYEPTILYQLVRGLSTADSKLQHSYKRKLWTSLRITLSTNATALSTVANKSAGNLNHLPGILGSQILRTGSAPPPASKDDPTPPTLRQCNALLHVWKQAQQITSQGQCGLRDSSDDQVQ